MFLPCTATRGERSQQESSLTVRHGPASLGSQHLSGKLAGALAALPAAALALVCAGGALGCQDPGEACQARFARGSYARAAEICARAFDRSGDPDAAVRAAGAAYHLGRADQVRAWAERLRGHPREAGVLYYLGRQQGDAGHVEAARATHERALAIARQHGDAREAGRNAFLLYRDARSRGAYTAALSHAYTSYAAARRAGNARGQRNAMEAAGNVLFDLGDIEGLRRALAELRRIDGPADVALQSRIALKQGALYRAEQRPRLAIGAFERALDLSQAAGHQALAHACLVNLASLSIELDDRVAAHAYLDAIRALDPGREDRASLLYEGQLARVEGRLDQAARSLARARDLLASPEWRWEIELELGRVAEQRGDLAAAGAAYNRAIALVEELRAGLASNELRAWALAHKRRPYEALFRLRARQGRADAALDALDRAKARSILDAFVAEAPATAADTAGAAADADGAGGSNAGGLAGAGPGDDALPGWMRRAVDRADALAALLPAMSAAPVTRPATSAPDAGALARALGERTALVYFRVEDALWLARVAGGRVELAELVSGRARLRDVDALVDELVRAPGDAGAAADLGRRLLPARLLPAAGTTLYLVADGPLVRLPFAALRVEDRYLVERHALVHVPSLGALAALEAHPRAPAAPPVVLGDPRGDLPDAAREAAHVAALMGVAPRVGGAATTAALRHATRARVLHVATHLEVDPRGAALILADGPVDAAQVVTWDLAPDLAVLAGCASAVQLTHRHGREMWGSMAAAFLASGARQVLAALWSIPDRATRAFLERFYAEGGARDPARALARAQRAWIASGHAPEEWAPFVLMGTAAPAPAQHAR